MTTVAPIGYTMDKNWWSLGKTSENILDNKIKDNSNVFKCS